MTTPARVGGTPEPDGTQPMSPAELRMVREWLGVSGEWLAEHLGVALRTVRRWEHGHATIPDPVRVEVEALEQVAAEQVGELVSELGDAADLVLTIPEADGAQPAGWWRMVAARVAQEVPGLYVRYDNTARRG